MTAGRRHRARGADAGRQHRTLGWSAIVDRAARVAQRDISPVVRWSGERARPSKTAEVSSRCLPARWRGHRSWAASLFGSRRRGRAGPRGGSRGGRARSGIRACGARAQRRLLRRGPATGRANPVLPGNRAVPAPAFRSRAGARVLLIGGPPFPETILMWWNFVARTPEEIAQARSDWEKRRRFGDVTAYQGPRLERPSCCSSRVRIRSADVSPRRLAMGPSTSGCPRSARPTRC